MPKKLLTKIFRVSSVSTNVRVGMRGMVLVSKDGETWEVGANSVNLRSMGDTVAVPLEGDLRNFNLLGLVSPRQVGKAPEDVIDYVWGEDAL